MSYMGYKNDRTQSRRLNKYGDYVKHSREATEKKDDKSNKALNVLRTKAYNV